MLEEGEGEDDGAAAGISLAVKADAAFVSMGSQEVAGRLSATSPDTNRVRVGLEGSRRIEAGNGAALIPSAEIGLRHDDGSLSAGTAADVGAGIVYRDPRARLVGGPPGAFAGSRTRRPAPGNGALPAWSATTPTRLRSGASAPRSTAATARRASGGTAALFALDRLEDMDAAGGTFPGGRLNAEAGYGLRAFGNGFTGRPSVRLGLAESGPAWRLGWWVAPGARPGAEPEGRHRPRPPRRGIRYRGCASTPGSEPKGREQRCRAPRNGPRGWCARLRGAAKGLYLPAGELARERVRRR